MTKHLFLVMAVLFLASFKPEGGYKVGDAVVDFKLKNVDDKMVSLSDFKDAKGFIVVFTCNHCPYARAYEGRLTEIANKYRPEGVGMVGICSNDAQDYPEDSFEQMIEKSKALGFPFPYLHDANQNVARAYDVCCTPECYLFDREHKLVYHGWVDDNHQQPELVQSQDLRNAIEATLAGKVPEKQLTAIIGCSIKWDV